MHVDYVELGTRVRVRRERDGLSPRDVQARTGISLSLLQKVEAGQPVRVTLVELDLLAQALDIALDELMYGSPVEERILAAARLNAEQESDPL
ncbi:MAG TPA: helix-turn-helix transcriptional regulator [Pseudonocardiaceae bacterium]